MNRTQILLNAYYERLYERLTVERDHLIAAIDRFLPAEIEARRFGPLSRDQMDAYRDACLAFVVERLESYNPIGIQYTFRPSTIRRAAELEFQLNWYESRNEFAELVATAWRLIKKASSDRNLPELADQLIQEAGAFPDRSIIAAYNAEPTLPKLPDYILACAIEQVISYDEP